MEEQLMGGEELPESPPEELTEETPAEEAPALPSFEEMQARLAELEKEVGNKTAALSEERDRRKISEGQYAQVMDYLKEARDRVAMQSQQAAAPEDDEIPEEYQDILKAWEKKYGSQVGQVFERLQQVEQFLQQGYQIQERARQFATQSQQFKQKQGDYDQAMNFLVDRVRQRAAIFVPDDQMREQVVAHEAQVLMQYSPEQLYQLAKLDGYQPQAPAQPNPNSGLPKQSVQTRPKSLASMPGASGVLPESFMGKAQSMISSTFKDIEKIPLEELDKLLKNIS